MSICVCAKCKKPWKALGSPARCPDRGQVSFAIAIQIGNPVTAETKAKISATLTGRPLTAETRAKMSAAHIGKHLTAETKAKVSAALRGRVRQAGSARGNLRC